MVTLTQQKLRWLVARYVPAAYQPHPTGPVRFIESASETDLVRLANALIRSTFQPGDLGGLCIDINELLGQSPACPRFHIYLNGRFRSRREAIFALLHEVGHVDWHVAPERRKGFQEDEGELYADWFAFDQLANTMGITAALDIASTFPSRHGLGRELAKAS